MTKVTFELTQTVDLFGLQAHRTGIFQDLTHQIFMLTPPESVVPDSHREAMDVSQKLIEDTDVLISECRATIAEMKRRHKLCQKLAKETLGKYPLL